MRMNGSPDDRFETQREGYDFSLDNDDELVEQEHDADFEARNKIDRDFARRCKDAPVETAYSGTSAELRRALLSVDRQAEFLRKQENPKFFTKGER